ncbi:MAG: UDP-N-acetylmuramoyl-tripeptide--D-alanyl-D-alanine ligase [Myxococcales bacterium]|nr:UDP-N-acetylmuramoyl-tripeptide--D-alanyl-D-alanine ligase [Myxococcales bacterium]
MTFEMRLSEVAAVTGGRVEGGDPETLLHGVSTDSRSLPKGSLFVALVAARDGHTFVPSALQNGAVAVLAQRSLTPEEKAGRTQLPVVVVEDTLQALGDLASAWLSRHRSHCKVVGITGSSGKTTGKEMLAAILQQVAPTHKTAGNFNNLIGLPLTVFGIDDSHHFAVLEMGMNAFGEIARMTEISRPDVGWITIVAPAHLEGVGSIDGVARAKGELFDGLGSQDTAIVNADDPKIMERAAKLRCERVFYSTDPDAASKIPAGARLVVLLQATPLGEDGFSVSAHSYEHGRISFRLPLVGRHQIGNALGAVAAATVLGATPDAIVSGFAQLQPEGRRLRVIHTPSNVHLIDDCYNSNPTSKKAAIQTLSDLAQDAPKIAVLGDMLELGGAEEELHAMIGQVAAQHHLTALFAFGPRSKAMAQAAIAGGMDASDVYHFEEAEPMWEALKARLTSGTWVLVKGSRGMRLERISQHLESYQSQATESSAAQADDQDSE